MTDDEKERIETNVTRFVTTRFRGMPVAALAAATGAAADLPVVETNVEIKTPDGTRDAVFIHPATGSHPGVLICRTRSACVLDARHRRGLPRRDFSARAESLLPSGQGAGDRRPRLLQFRIQPTWRSCMLMASVNAPGVAEKDAVILRSSAQSQVNKAKKIGTQGYCMAGR